MNRKLKIFLLAAGVCLAPVLLSPLPGFRQPLATVVMASDSTLLGARIADDGQWRFPPAAVPQKFRTALLETEDRWFMYHPGINPLSVFRALRDNIRSGEVVSGGSTITMQVARMAGGNKPRTYANKILEMFSAFKLELFRSKKSILEMYAANAPFGGNIVGLEAAAWRYTSKASSSLSWSEAATLAILPNSPGLIFPGRNENLLREKRDRLLRKLYERKHIDSLTYILALDEEVPGHPLPLPARATHLTDYFHKTARGNVTITTIDAKIQERALKVLEDHHKELSANRINNAACIIVEVKTGNVLAYAGNVTDSTIHSSDVDIIRSKRSTGSILKPFLYAAMQQSGELLPNSLVADIPSRFPGFSPKNFDLTFSGAVGAGDALTQSLNVPAVKMLQDHGTERFLDLLKETGFRSLTKSADHYGLSLILGGGETTLWELAGAYASLSRVLNNYNNDKKYYTTDYHEPLLVGRETAEEKTEDLSPPLTASAIWLTYDALLRVNRPETESGWQYFSSSPRIAWKTGTSFGFRDGWAVGTTPEHVIAVWTGNADGEGRPGLTGITAAAPIMFDLVNITGPGQMFAEPSADLTMITVCKQSGFRAGLYCEETTETAAHINGLRTEQCPYHRIVHLDRTGSWQVTSKCEDPELIRNIQWFVLPPAIEYYYRQNHPEYKIPPPALPGCTDGEISSMEFIYPANGLKIFIPRDETGKKTRIIAEVAHRNQSKKIFWHVDESFLGITRSIHQIEVEAGMGSHTLTAVDEDGNSSKVHFIVINE